MKSFRFARKLLQNIFTDAVFGDGRAIFRGRNVKHFLNFA
jgi:hypothetical protein